MNDRYGSDVLADSGWKKKAPPPKVVEALRGVVVEEVASGFVGAIVGIEGRMVKLEDRRGKVRVFPIGPGFLIDGQAVALRVPKVQPKQTGPLRSASGSFAVEGAKARVARGSRIFVEGRHDDCFLVLEARADGGEVVVIATASAASIRQRWTAVLPAGDVTLRIETAPPPVGFVPGASGGDRIRLVARVGDTETLVTELDGRHWSMESAASFTGRVVGPHASAGAVAFLSYSYSGSEAS